MGAVVPTMSHPGQNCSSIEARRPNVTRPGFSAATEPRCDRYPAPTRTGRAAQHLLAARLMSLRIIVARSVQARPGGRYPRRFSGPGPQGRARRPFARSDPSCATITVARLSCSTCHILSFSLSWATASAHAPMVRVFRGRLTVPRIGVDGGLSSRGFFAPPMSRTHQDHRRLVDGRLDPERFLPLDSRPARELHEHQAPSSPSATASPSTAAFASFGVRSLVGQLDPERADRDPVGALDLADLERHVGRLCRRDRAGRPGQGRRGCGNVPWPSGRARGTSPRARGGRRPGRRAGRPPP